VLLSLWTRIGVQSFGGGQAVQLLAQEELVDHRAWLTSEEWSEAWGICQMVPGVNVVAVAALTGSRLAGLAGAGASLLGLLLPSVAITILVTSVYSSVRDLNSVRAVLHGIVLAAAGGSVLIGYRLIRPVLSAGLAEGRVALISGVLTVIVAAALAATGRVPLLALLLAAGAAMAGTLILIDRRRRPAPAP
jgi:chromate transporter